MLTATLAQARAALSRADYELIVQPTDGLEAAPKNLRNEYSSWLPETRLAALYQMARRSPLIDAAVQTFKSNARQWKYIVESANPLLEEFPALRVDGQPVLLDNFVKLCFVKALTPGKFIPALREVVILEQGEEFLSPPLFDLERSYADSSPATPLIFVLPGADPLQALAQFAKRKKKSETLRSISLG